LKDKAYHYRPFPKTIDIPNENTSKEPSFLLLEYFGDSVSLNNLQDTLEDLAANGDVNPSLIQDVVMRFCYIYAYWGLLFITHDFSHNDFHGDNVLLNIKLKVKKAADLKQIGLNHMYAIDLDTLELPVELASQSFNKRLDEITRKKQIKKPDCFNVSWLIVNTIYRFEEKQLMKEYITRTNGKCAKKGDEIVPSWECSVEEQLDTLSTLLNMLWWYDFEAWDQRVLAGLPGPDDYKEFVYSC